MISSCSYQFNQWSLALTTKFHLPRAKTKTSAVKLSLVIPYMEVPTEMLIPTGGLLGPCTFSQTDRVQRELVIAEREKTSVAYKIQGRPSRRSRSKTNHCRISFCLKRSMSRQNNDAIILRSSIALLTAATDKGETHPVSAC